MDQNHEKNITYKIRKIWGQTTAFQFIYFFQIFMVECCLAMFSEFTGTLMQI